MINPMISASPINNPILQLHNLSIIDQRNQQPLLQGINLSVAKNQTLAIVGESGSGKSLLTKAIMGLLHSNLTAQGSIRFQQQELLHHTPRQWQQLRGKRISLIVQNAMGAFDPLMTIGAQFKQTLQCHLSQNKAEQQQTINHALQQVKLQNVHNLLHSHPCQLSGGQLQRVMIAFALALQPDIIIADEPTTALDAITQYDIMQQFKALATQHHTTLIFISHDLGLIKEIADHIAVIKQGQLIEYASKQQLLSQPQHPYSQYLLNSRQQLTQRFQAIMSKPHATNR